MAALVAPPYRSSPSALPSTSPSSSSSASSSAAAKKQENSAAVAAGRRRLEEFKRKKAAEKGKKNTGASSSDEAAQNISGGEPRPLPPATGDSSGSPSKPAETNGHGSRNSLNEGINLESRQHSSPTEVAMVPEQTGPILPVVGAQFSTAGQVRKGPDSKELSSGGRSDDSSSIRSTLTNALEQPITSLSRTSLGISERLGAGQDSNKANRVGMPRPPLSAAGPLFVPAPPPVTPEISGSFNTVYGKQDARRNPVSSQALPARHSSPGEDTQNSFNRTVNGGNVVSLGSYRTSSQKPLPPSVPQPHPEPEHELTFSGMSNFPSTSTQSNVGLIIDKQADRSTSGASFFSQSSNKSTSLVKTENGKGSIHLAVNNSSDTSPPSLETKSSKLPESSDLLRPPFSEAAAPKLLPLPPPLFRPLTAGPIFKKPELVLPPVFNKASDSTSSSSSLSSTFPSTTTLLDNALVRPIAPMSLQFPAPVSAINVPLENGHSHIAVDSFRPVVPTPSVPYGEFPDQSVKTTIVDQSGQLWTPSGGDDLLEQHIEDLTQEKFSLQRGLDAARALADSLAQENSALTEDYNNQGALVNELKAESDKLHAEIRAQSVVVKNMKAERDKAVHESNAAVERSQALAAEVITLEEKVLRARSQELKLTREMESLRADIESQKRQMSSLDKDRANLKSLVEALQEEKGLLQTQIWKATSGASSGDSWHANTPSKVGSAGPTTADACTSTEDIDWATFSPPCEGFISVPHPGMRSPLMQTQSRGFGYLDRQDGQPIIVSSIPSRPLSSPSYANQASTSFSASGGAAADQSFSAPPGLLTGRGLSLGPVASAIPPDQSSTIDNINSLITELAEEKEALLKALRAESVGAAELRNLNSELSHKLEVQTQRLELAVAQSMAHSGTPSIGSTYVASRMAPEYIDEGDEVVERVLGWIMQLFPSGSSRRKRL